MRRKWMILRKPSCPLCAFLFDELGCPIRQESRAFREATDAFDQHVKVHGYYGCIGNEAAAIGHNLLLRLYDQDCRTEELVLKLRFEDTKVGESFPTGNS